MIRYFITEARIALPWGILLLPPFFAILRLTKVVSPEVPEIWVGWISFLEFIFPIIFPLLVFGLLEQEKRWRALEVMVATPRRKAAIFLVRYLILLFPLFLAVAAAVRPEEYLLLMAPGLALGGVTLLVGLAWDEEIGLGMGLAWWGGSFATAMVKGELLGHPIASWFFLILRSAPLSPEAFSLHKWAHLGAGFLLSLLALGVAELKRSWRAR